MTPTTTRFGSVPENIAEAVRHSHGPTGDMAELSAQAQRLGRALDVAEKWIEAAGTSTEMWYPLEPRGGWWTGSPRRPQRRKGASSVRIHKVQRGSE
jgi:hypothetical protein